MTMTEQDRSRLEQLERRVGMLDNDLGQLTQLLRQAAAEAEDGAHDHDPGPRVVRDALWTCDKCNARLGMYDPGEDVLRIRYRDHTVHVHPGVGGWVKCLCRGCAYENVLRYAPPQGDDEDRGGG